VSTEAWDLHYQCVFYGGRLLKHLSAEVGAGADDAINILRVNRHAVLLIDSDKRVADAGINTTKARMVQEVTASGGLAWVTAGREVENYIPQAALAAAQPSVGTDVLDQYGDVAEFLEQHEAGAAGRFERQKVVFAEQVVSHLTVEALEATLDWRSQIDSVLHRIKVWNGLG
jgi:hypothetical protein